MAEPPGLWEPELAVPCGRAGCMCTHTGGCVAGWLDGALSLDPDPLYAGTSPCPVCRPEQAGIVRGADTRENRARIGHSLRARGRIR